MQPVVDGEQALAFERGVKSVGSGVLLQRRQKVFRYHQVALPAWAVAPRPPLHAACRMEHPSRPGLPQLCKVARVNPLAVRCLNLLAGCLTGWWLKVVQFIELRHFNGAVLRRADAAGGCWLVMLGEHVRESLWFQELPAQYLIGLAAFFALEMPLK